MNPPDFSQFILEYEAQGIGEGLYSFIWEAIEQVVKGYPANIYSPNGVWDEDAVAALCHDFVMDKLLKGGWLEYYLVSLETTAQFKYAIQRDFRHLLINRAKRSEFQNLVRRVQKILTTNSRFKILPTKRVWGLSNWETCGVVQQLEGVVKSMYKVPLPPLTHYRVNSQKISHLISNNDLEHLLFETLNDLGECVEFVTIIHALRYRLNLPDVVEFSLDEAIDPTMEDSDTYADLVPNPDNTLDIELNEIAQQIYSQLSIRQKKLLFLYISQSNPTLESIGQQLGVSKSTVSNDLNQIQKYVTSAEVSTEDADKLLGILFDLSSSIEFDLS